MALRRLSDIQHDLLNDDFAQGGVVRALPDESAVQNWFADRLRTKQGRSFSVEREVQVVDEKEPDIRLRAKATDASVAMEIKVAESWSVTDLEQALTAQLSGQYLRARDGRHGILLLVHQEPKRRGWRKPEGDGYLTFDQLVSRLNKLVATIAGSASDAPEPAVATVNVSGIPLVQKKSATAKKSRAGARRVRSAKAGRDTPNPRNAAR